MSELALIIDLTKAWISNCLDQAGLLGGGGGGGDTALLNYIDVGGSSPLWIDSNIPRQVVGMSKKAG